MTSMAAASRPRRDRWIPWSFVAMMLLVIAVNGGLVYAALSTFTGVAVDESYEHGRVYNQVIDAQRRQDALGWQLGLAREGDHLTIVARGPDGAPLTDLALTGSLIRPVDPLPDRPLAFDNLGGGRYQTTIAAAAAGQWDARVIAVRGANRFVLVERVIVK